jgi:hypothetical protein
VVQDLCDLLQGNGFYAPCEASVAAKNDGKLCFYVRGASDTWLDANTAESWGEGIVTKPVAVDEIHGWLKNHPDCFLAAIR